MQLKTGFYFISTIVTSPWGERWVQRDSVEDKSFVPKPVNIQVDEAGAAEVPSLPAKAHTHTSKSHADPETCRSGTSSSSATARSSSSRPAPSTPTPPRPSTRTASSSPTSAALPRRTGPLLSAVRPAMRVSSCRSFGRCRWHGSNTDCSSCKASPMTRETPGRPRRPTIPIPRCVNYLAVDTSLDLWRSLWKKIANTYLWAHRSCSSTWSSLLSTLPSTRLMRSSSSPLSTTSTRRGAHQHARMVTVLFGERHTRA